ncbi:uncharacterized protein LOC128673905 [Plodia interpunctella]|uniref:uncharacterized protein LOC128673905 n=1 Tax=Plodia interpunctella TaxID=58824 RepID=UPI0023677F27|nr:uncharacterized protein LOC128673905 [Plodia interpunctella]XP_053608047.1 uncharacterized protein LOC128673905 [Plodia interpunctella]
MATRSHISMNLCLSPNVNVYIKEDIPKHVINGVRFIYKQFVKEKPGVILNDPADYDQETQVALFLNGTRNRPDKHIKTVLILCEPDKVPIWNDCLMKWMPDFDEVAIDWPKPSSKKSVYVATTDRLESYHRREWDALVVDDDSFLQYKLTPSEFKVDFKIFITADDLRENLHKFSQIYRWLYPDKKIDVNNFKPNTDTISDILQKRIWFGAFVEDMLIRNASSLIRIADNTYREVPKEPRRITRKNKDATGTKIKRTKRKFEVDNTDIPNKKVSVPSDHSNGNTNIDICNSKLEVSNNGYDRVESFIRDQEPLKIDESIDFPDLDEKMSHTSKMDVAEAKLDASDSDTAMKLNYSDENSDDAYGLETQDNEVDNNNLHFKENDFANADENKADNSDANNVENGLNANIDVKKSDVSVHNDLALCNTVDSLIDGKLESVETHTENNMKFKEDNTKIENDPEKQVAKADDLDSKWEEMALKKFKGSLLDRIF